MVFIACGNSGQMGYGLLILASYSLIRFWKLRDMPIFGDVVEVLYMLFFIA